MIRSLLLLAGLMALTIFAGLSPIYAACGGVTTVSNETELNDAIDDFNGEAGPCAYEIEFDSDITLTGDLNLITNNNGGVSLLIDGAGFMLDSAFAGWAFNIQNTAQVTIQDITVTRSLSNAIFSTGSDLSVLRSTIHNNDGDGIDFNDGDLLVVDSTLAENSGGLDVYRNVSPTTVTLINSTIAGNGDFGVYLGQVTGLLTHVTITDNFEGIVVNSGDATINNSVLAGNSEWDCSLFSGTLDVNFSLVEAESPFVPCGVTDGVDGNIFGHEAYLGALGDYGGPTPTVPLLEITGSVTAASPAIDAGDDALSDDENGAPLTTDQRGAGFPRLILPEVDMGAVEGPEDLVCSTVMTVNDEAELNNAIYCFNQTTTAGAYEIQFAADISLTDDVRQINNPTGGISLLVDGAGFTLNGSDDYDGFDIFGTPDIAIHNITVTNADGDAIYSEESNLRVSDSTIRDTDGDAIDFQDGALVVVESTVINSYDNALDIDSEGTPTSATVINTTLAGNGIVNDATAVTTNDVTALFTHVTFYGNARGLEVDESDVTINNSILAGSEGSDCILLIGTIDVNFSFVGDDNLDFPCGVSDGVDGNIVGGDPQLLPLGDYGGSTLTMPPYELTGGVTLVSVVVDQGDDALSKDEEDDPLFIDQRGPGFPRVIPPEADMGAVEGPETFVCAAFPVTVNDEAELNAAILCYSGLTTPGSYTISLGNDIDLTAATYPAANPTAGVALVIEGNGNAIDGQDTPGVRPLSVAEDTTVTLNNATITGGHTNDGGGIYNAGQMNLNQVTVELNTAENDGGGIYNALSGEMEINDSSVDSNQAIVPNGDGGGITNAGYMVITDSTVISNSAEDNGLVLGGGIFNEGDLDVIRSTIANNTITADEDEAFGGGIANQANLVIRDSTISGNSITADFVVDGGGIFFQTDRESVDNGFIPLLFIVNSTISNNTAAGDEDVSGGGIYATDDCCFDDPIPFKLINSTVADNTVTANDFFGGGGLYLDQNGNGLTVTIRNSILALNSTGGDPGGDCQSNEEGGLVFESLYSLYEDTGDDACGLAAANPDGDGNIVGQDPDLGPLANNGGPTLTHLPGDASGAINAGDNDLAVDENGDPLAGDQRGFTPRVVNFTVDMGSVEVDATGPAAEGIFMSTTVAGTTGDGLPFGAEDILGWDGSGWSLWFDGSAAGLMPSGNAKHNVNAFWIPDSSADDVVMSFVQNARVVPGIGPEKVDGMDLVWWNGSTFSLWFDGNDVALTNKTQEKIDGLHVLPGSESPIGGGCISYLLISTQGPGKVPNHSGGTLSFSGEDVLGFCMTNSGSSTTGLWHMVLDGSAQGMPKNATDSISLSADGETLYLTTKGTFNEDSAGGGHSMVYAYDFGTQEFSGPFFEAAAEGLPKKVDGLQVEGSLD